MDVCVWMWSRSINRLVKIKAPKVLLVPNLTVPPSTYSQYIPFIVRYALCDGCLQTQCHVLKTNCVCVCVGVEDPERSVSEEV